MIRCPKCGNTNPALFQLLDEMTVGWAVQDVEDGLIIANGLYESYESVNNDRLYCEAPVEGEKYAICGTEFPIPEGMKVDYR